MTESAAGPGPGGPAPAQAAGEPTAELVGALLREQHPDLAALPVRAVPGGWDNKQFRLGEDLAVRMPVPAPVRAGAPSALFGRPWAVVRWVHGVPADLAPVIATDSAEALAAFLTALHQVAPADAPVSPVRGNPLGQHRDGFEHWFSRCLAGWARAAGSSAGGGGR